jgi:hypothetical protein
MSQLVSSTLPAGYTGVITADQFNRLRDDLMKHHDHSTDHGGQISHADLVDGVIDGTYLSHALLNKHVQGAGIRPTPDNPGGAQGVHGLDGSGAYVAGITKRQLMCQIGSGTTDKGGTADDELEQRGRGTFGLAFAEPPAVVLALNTVGYAASTTVYQVLNTSFAVKFRFITGSTYSDGSQHNIPFVWLALGVIEE